MGSKMGLSPAERIAKIKTMLEDTNTVLKSALEPDMTHGALYETITKQKAILEESLGNEEAASAYYLESTGVSARQQYCTRVNASKFPKMMGEPKDKPEEKPPLQIELVDFSSNPLDFRKRLADLPSDCVIIQLSEIFPGTRQYPRQPQCHPLRIARFGCGDHYTETCVHKMPKPHALPASRNTNILEELKAILKEHTEVLCTPKSGNYKAKRLIFEERFKIVLEAMRDWIGPWRCLLLGKLVDETKRNDIDAQIKALVKEMKIDKKYTVTLSLLTQCVHVFTKVDLVFALESICPPTAEKNKVNFVLTTLSKMKKIAADLIGTGPKDLDALERHPVILIVDKAIFPVPWEQIDVIRSQPVSRMPCLALVEAVFKSPRSQRSLDSRSTYFVVDPDKNLPATAKRLAPVLQARDEWKGIISSSPPAKMDFAKILEETDIYLYCGHGSGSHFVPTDAKLQVNSAAMLLGCSSADILRRGVHWELDGVPLNFLLSGSPISLGMLWTVTDQDADRMTVRLIETWLPLKKKDSKYKLELCQQDISYGKVFEDVQAQKGLLKALRSAQSAANSIIMSSAFIAFGIPVYVKGTSILK